MRTKIEAILSGKSETIYLQILDSIAEYDKPSSFIGNAWRYYNDNFKSEPSINGRIFEYLICESLANEKIIPFYFQAKFLNVPNCEFDIVLYHPKKPVVLSAKTSLRERYKQSDLEGLALRQVYRQAVQYLLTLSESEVPAIKTKIESGDIAGIDDILLADQEDIDQLFAKLKSSEFEIAKSVQPLSSQQMID